MRYALIRKISGTDNVLGLFPAEFADGRKKIAIVDDSEPIMTGRNEIGGIWLDMKNAGWDWVQAGAFGPRYYEANA